MSPISAPLRRLPTVLACALIAVGLLGVAATAQDGEAGTRVDILPLEGPIDPMMASGISHVLGSAASDGVDLVVLQMDTPGGLAVSIDDVLTSIRESAVPVAVYAGPGLVDARVEGLGVLMLLQAHIAAMAPDATLGPALPVDLGDTLEAGLPALEGLAPPEVVDRLARGVVAPDEAVEHGIVDLVADGVETLLVDLDGVTVTTPSGTTVLDIKSEEVSVRFTTIGLGRRILHAASTPTLLYLTLLIGLALLVFEMFQPGFGVAGVAAIVLLPISAYGAVVLPVAWWAVALLVVGVALLAADVAIAGLGPPTAAGTVALLVGSVWLFPSEFLGVAGWIIGVMVAGALVFFVVIMTIILRAQAGPDREVVAALIGTTGVVRSTLNPEGHVYIDGALWRSRVTGEDGKVVVGTPVEVHAVDGAVLLVRVADGAPAGTEAGADVAGDPADR